MSVCLHVCCLLCIVFTSGRVHWQHWTKCEAVRREEKKEDSNTSMCGVSYPSSPLVKPFILWNLPFLCSAMLLVHMAQKTAPLSHEANFIFGHNTTSSILSSVYFILISFIMISIKFQQSWQVAWSNNLWLKFENSNFQDFVFVKQLKMERWHVMLSLSKRHFNCRPYHCQSAHAGWEVR